MKKEGATAPVVPEHLPPADLSIPDRLAGAMNGLPLCANRYGAQQTERHNCGNLVHAAYAVTIQDQCLVERRIIFLRVRLK
jgi:hypothetical protein